MGFIASIVAILGGLVASSTFITSKRPDAQGFIAKVAEFKSALGLLLLFWGLFGLWRLLLKGVLYSGGFSILLLILAEIVVGFLLSYDLYQRYVGSKSAKANEMGHELKNSFERFQTPAGLVLLILGVLNLFGII